MKHEKLKWLHKNIPFHQVMQWEKEDGHPMEDWEDEDINDLYDASQPTLKDN